MSQAGSEKQQRWNQRYKEKQSNGAAPAAVLTLNKSLLSGSGKALDLACGLGGNAIYLAECGYKVTAVDYSDVVLEKLDQFTANSSLKIETQLCDLENQALGDHEYDLIVVSYYLQRNLFPEIFKLLKQGGLLFYQTFGVAAEGSTGPKNPEFRLKKAELLSLCDGHGVVYYREDQGCCVGDDCFNSDAMIVVRKV